MRDEQSEKLARVLVDYSIEAGEGDQVLVSGQGVREGLECYSPVLASGKFADVVVFDAAAFRDRATYQKPTELATGMKYVVVNGKVAVDNGAYTGITPGVGITR